MKLLLLTVAAVVVAVSSEENEKVFSKSTAAFNGKFSTVAFESNPGKSAVMSPFSVEPLLAQLSGGAVGESHDQILRTLDFPSDDFVKAVFPPVMDQLNATKGVTLSLATIVYSPTGYELNPNFKRDSVNIFRSDIQSLDFTKSVAAANTINSWVASKTNNKITDLISADSLSALTRLVLCNAIYFKGDWKTKFDKSHTQDRDFHTTSTQTVKIPTMYIESKFKYYDSEALDAQILELPYVGEEVVMVIVLPKQVEGLSALQKKLQDPNILAEERKKMYTDTVQVQLPKFKIESTFDLKDILTKLGITDIFDAAKSGLVNLLEGGKEKLYVSKAVQKAFIEVNEEGAEAGAANVVAIASYSAISFHDPKRFVADRPFLFYLQTPKILLFSGHFAN